jgi:dTDP-4-amino-4,6-dideoxygalactose transaminase
VIATRKLCVTLKRHRGDLAIHGGRPAFDSPLHVGRPYLGKRERLLERYNAVLDGGWVTNNGPLVQELEAKLAARIGVEHFIAVCNGSLALQLCLRALGLGGEIIVPAFTFVATAHAVAWEGMVPVFADISRDTHCVDPDKVEGLVSRRTSAVVGVHLWGRACDIEGLAAMARRHGTRLIFDAAHAFACTHRGRQIGNFGDAEVFSFHATKFFHTLEGGGVATNDGDLAQALRRLRNHGFTGIDQVAGLGTNAKMSEVCAATGLSLLEEVDELIDINLRNDARYRAALAGIPGLRLIAYDERERSNRQFVVAEVDAARAGISRDALVGVLRAENVLARRYFFPGCHRFEPYRSRGRPADRPLPETDHVAARVVCLPTGPTVSEADIDTIGEIIRLACAE